MQGVDSEKRDPGRALWENNQLILPLHQIPENRTCMDAGIPVLYSVCLSSQPLSTQSPLARQAGLALLSALNAAIAPVNDVCHNMTLSNVSRVALLEARGLFLGAATLRNLSYKGT